MKSNKQCGQATTKMPHLGSRVDHVQVIDQLSQVLNGVDVVVGRRTDQRHTWGQQTNHDGTICQHKLQIQ